MAECPYQFTVEVRRDGALLGSASASVASCAEDALWWGVLAGRVENGIVPAFEVMPVWAESGPPLVAGVRVAGAGEPGRVYDSRCFEHKAREIVLALVAARKLDQDAVIEWFVVAGERSAPPARRFKARASRAPYPLRAARLPQVARETLAIVIERTVVDTIRERFLASGPVECAGILVGELTYDRERAAALLAIGGEIPVAAGEGGVSGRHFSFGVQSFTAAGRLLACAGIGSVAAGWHHSHPPCAECPRRPTCNAHTVFLSHDDVKVHASAFAAPYAVALVVGKVHDRPATDPGIQLYAWEHGALARRPLVPLTGSGALAAEVANGAADTAGSGGATLRVERVAREIEVHPESSGGPSIGDTP